MCNCEKQEKIYYSRPEAAAYLGITPGTLQTWVSNKNRQIPYRRVGRTSEYKKSDLDKFIKRRERESRARAAAKEF